MSAQEVRIKDKQIKTVENWPKSILIRDIPVFIGFANFYQHFIKSFTRNITLLTSLLKIIKLSKLALKAFKIDNNKIVDSDGGRSNEMFINSFKNKKSRNLIYELNIGAIRESIFLIPNAKKIFN